MATMSPEEWLKEHGHLLPTGEALCGSICENYQETIDLLADATGKRKQQLEVRLTLIAKEIQQNHCRCFLQ
jgi:hypothetical protein